MAPAPAVGIGQAPALQVNRQIARMDNLYGKRPADFSGFDGLPHRAMGRSAPQMVVGGEHNFGRLAGLHHIHRIRQICCKRLLAENMFASLGRGNTLAVVQIIGCGDVDGVNRRIQKLPRSVVDFEIPNSLAYAAPRCESVLNDIGNFPASLTDCIYHPFTANRGCSNKSPAQVFHKFRSPSKLSSDKISAARRLCYLLLQPLHEVDRGSDNFASALGYLNGGRRAASFFVIGCHDIGHGYRIADENRFQEPDLVVAD